MLRRAAPNGVTALESVVRLVVCVAGGMTWPPIITHNTGKYNSKDIRSVRTRACLPLGIRVEMPL